MAKLTITIEIEVVPQVSQALAIAETHLVYDIVDLIQCEAINQGFDDPVISTSVAFEGNLQ